MLLLGFLLLPMAVTAEQHVQKGNYDLTIKSVLTDICETDKSSDDLNLSNMDLATIDQYAFSHLENVKTLNLANNSIRGLPKFVFVYLQNLEHLDLSNNVLDSGNFYQALRNLKTLNISNNPVFSFGPGHFFGLTKSTDILTQGLTRLNYISAAMFEDVTLTYTKRRPENETSNTPNWDSESRFQVCIQKGHLKSLEEFKQGETLKEDCQEVERVFRAYPIRSLTILSLTMLDIKTFESGWYRLQDHNIEGLDFSGNNISQVTKQLLNDLPRKIVAVDLSSNFIRQLQRGVIESPIKSLNLTNNLISKIEDGALEKLNLTDLYLDYNELKNLQFLSSLSSGIKFLGLSNNKISGISAGNNIPILENQLTETASSVFSELPDSLQSLDLHNNRIEILRAGTFENVPNYYLDLSGNKISKIEKGSFNLPHLKELYLDSNLLNEIDGDSFEGLGELGELSLTWNGIARIKKGAAKNLNNLYLLDISNNPIKILENGALFGLCKTGYCTVKVSQVPVEIIQCGLFDNA